MSDDGTVDLVWSMPDEPMPDAVDLLEFGDDDGRLSYRLEQATRADFADARLRYEGPDPASVLTGLREGDYHFRVRATGPDGESGPWSEPLVLHVEFMGRRTLTLLLVTGGLVATMTIVAIISGFLKNR